MAFQWPWSYHCGYLLATAAQKRKTSGNTAPSPQIVNTNSGDGQVSIATEGDVNAPMVFGNAAPVYITKIETEGDVNAPMVFGNTGDVHITKEDPDAQDRVNKLRRSDLLAKVDTLSKEADNMLRTGNLEGALAIANDCLKVIDQEFRSPRAREEEDLQARLHQIAGMSLASKTPPDSLALEHFEKAYELYGKLNDSLNQAMSSLNMGIYHSNSNFTIARLKFTDCISLLDLASMNAEPSCRLYALKARAYNNLGMADLNEAFTKKSEERSILFDEAVRWLKKAVEAGNSAGAEFEPEMAPRYQNLAVAHYWNAEYTEALDIAKEAERINRMDSGDKHLLPYNLEIKALALMGLGSIPEAEEALKESQRFHRVKGNFDSTIIGLLWTALLCRHKKQWEKAAELVGALDGLIARHNDGVVQCLFAEMRDEATSEIKLHIETYDKLYQFGRDMTDDEAFSLVHKI